MGGLLGGGGELRPELPERQELCAVADEAEGRDVPERGRSAVAENDLIAVGQGEELRETRAEATHLGLHGLLAVRRAQVGAGHVEQPAHLLAAHLGRTRAEASIARQEIGGDDDVVAHDGKATQYAGQRRTEVCLDSRRDGV